MKRKNLCSLLAPVAVAHFKRAAQYLELLAALPMLSAITTGLLFAVLALPFLLTGCGQREVEPSTSKADVVQLFEKGKGLRLPEEMQKVLGVQTIEVTETALPRRFKRSARVYRAADGARPAAAVVLIDESQTKELIAGQEVFLKRDDLATAEFVGKLVRFDSQATVLGQVEALLEFPDAERRLPVGSFLQAIFIARKTEPVFVVPESAVVKGADGPFVYAANGSHFTRTPVKVIAASDGWVGIVDGVYEGDVVVTKAAEALWMIELCALKGGTPCCPVPMKTSSGSNKR